METDCPSCGETLSCPREFLGQVLPCPRCGEGVVFPPPPPEPGDAPRNGLGAELLLPELYPTPAAEHEEERDRNEFTEFEMGLAFVLGIALITFAPISFVLGLVAIASFVGRIFDSLAPTLLFFALAAICLWLFYRGLIFYKVCLRITTPYAYRKYKLTIPGDDGDRSLAALFLVAVTLFGTGILMIIFGAIAGSLWFLLPGLLCLAFVAVWMLNYTDGASRGFNVAASGLSLSRGARWVLNDAAYVLFCVFAVLIVFRIVMAALNSKDDRK